MKFSQVKVDDYFKFPGTEKSLQKSSPFGYKDTKDFAVLGEIQVIGDPEVEIFGQAKQVKPKIEVKEKKAKKIKKT